MRVDRDLGYENRKSRSKIENQNRKSKIENQNRKSKTQNRDPKSKSRFENQKLKSWGYVLECWMLRVEGGVFSVCNCKIE